MENFSDEVVSLICDDFVDDKDLVIKVLFYLYNTTTDDKMKVSIKDVFIDEGVCLECGSKLITYDDKLYCPYCD